MGVLAERERDRGVSESLADDLRGHPGGQGRGDVAVPQVVQPDPGQPAGGDLPLNRCRITSGCTARPFSQVKT
jgi:hypothetical protein